MSIIAGFMLYFGIRYMRGSEFFSSSNKYFAVYESIDGLTASNPVILNGLNVGKVRNIELMPEQGNQIKVTFQVKEDIKLTDKSVAVLTDKGLLGSKAIEISLMPGTLLENHGQVKSKLEKSLADEFQEKTDPILRSIDTTLFSVQELVIQTNEEMKKVDIILTNVANASQGLSQMVATNRGNIDGTLRNLNQFSQSLAEARGQLLPTMQKLNNFADTLQSLPLHRTVANANESLSNINRITHQMSQGQGTVGKLLYDQSLYVNLNNSTASLNSLLQDLEANPKRYVHFSLFGRKDKDEEKKK